MIESDPPRKLVQTWHPVWDPAGAAEPPTTLTLEIMAQPGGGWAWVLSDLKTLLETGASMGR